MSRAFTVTPKTRTKAVEKGGNASTSQALNGKVRQKLNSPSGSASFKKKLDSSSNVAVVTLKDLHPQGSKKTPAKPRNKHSKRKHKFTRRKSGQSTKMWDDQQPGNDRFNAQPPSMPSRRNLAAGYHGNDRQDDAKMEANPPQASDVNRRDTYQPQGSYTRITPDSRKREQLQQQRSDELARLEAYKEKKKLGYVSVKPSPVGGSKISQEEARRQQQREQNEKKYEMIRKRQQWAEEKKKREEEEFAEKKAKARGQTEKNKQLERERQMRLQAERQDWVAMGGLVRFDTESNEWSTSGLSHEVDEDKGKGFTVDENSVRSLMGMFPLKSRCKIVDMLKSARGDVNKVIDWLSD